MINNTTTLIFIYDRIALTEIGKIILYKQKGMIYMIIKNGFVFQEDGTFRKMDLYTADGKLVSSPDEAENTEELDASGLKVLPGAVDIHSHGAFGHDFSDADTEGLKKILQYEKSHGITSYCPTSMTLPRERLLSIFATALQAGNSPEQARIAGINMEGPFIDPLKKGAHVESYIHKPDIEFFRECNKKSGSLIKLVTLAPNMEDADTFINELKDEVKISIGHTTASYDCARKAMEAGANHVTHLFNAMPPFAHRDPGVVGAAADVSDCMAELICDGIHIHPSAVRTAFRIFGSERIILISDSMMATGMDNGTYELGGQKVTVNNKKAILTDGTIAGSATNLFDCMKKAMEFGIPEADAIFAATRNPAKSIGIYHMVGSLTPGKYADIVLTDESYNIVKVL